MFTTLSSLNVRIIEKYFESIFESQLQKKLQTKFMALTLPTWKGMKK